MGYEVFSRKTSRAGTPMLTISKLGRISFNKHATNRLSKDVVEFVILLWDKEARRIAIRPISKKEPRAYRVTYGIKGNGAGFSAKTFFDFIEYDYTESRSFPVEWNDQENMYETKISAEHFKSVAQRKLMLHESVGKN